MFRLIRKKIIFFIIMQYGESGGSVVECLTRDQGIVASNLSGRVLDSRSKDCGFEPHQRHCFVSLSKTLFPCVVLVQPNMTKNC